MGHYQWIGQASLLLGTESRMHVTSQPVTIQLFSAPGARFELLAPSAVVVDRVHKLGVTRK